MLYLSKRPSFWRRKEVAEIRRVSPLATQFLQVRYPHSEMRTSGENEYARCRWAAGSCCCDSSLANRILRSRL